MSANSSAVEPASPRSIGELYGDLGRALSAHGRHAEAAGAFEHALAETPAGPAAFDTHLELGAAYVRTDRRGLAFRTFLNAALAAPGQARVALNHAHALVTRDLAVTEADWINTTWAPAARAQAPTPADHAAVLVLLGRLHLYAQHHDKALPLFAEARTLAPDDAHAIEGLGESLWKAGDLAGAREALEQAVNIASVAAPGRQSAIRAKLGQVLAASGEYEGALAHLAHPGTDNNPYAYELAIVRSQCALAVGEPDKALAHADTAAQLQPSAVAPHVLRARASIALGRYTDAVNAANAALQADPSERHVAFYRAQALIEGQIDIALGRRLLKRHAERLATGPDELAESILPGRGDDGNAHYFLAEVRAARGQFDEALAAVEQALSLRLLNERTPPETPAQRLKAECLAARGETQTAAATFREAGSNFVSRGEMRLATECLQQATALAPTDRRSWWLLAEALRMSSDRADENEKASLLSESVAAWERGFALGALTADESWGYVVRAYIAEQGVLGLNAGSQAPGRWEAVAWLERAIVLQPADALRWAVLCRHYRLLDAETNALAASDQALRHDPNDLFVLDERAAAAANAGRFDIAETALTQRLGMESTAWAKGVQAFVLLHTGRYADALTAIEATLQDTPDDLWSLDFRAMCLRVLGQREEATATYTAIWKRYDEADRANATTFAWAAYQLGRFEDAIALFQRDAAESAQQRFTTVAGLGLAWLGAGDIAQGERYLTSATALATTTTELDDFIAFDIPEAVRAAGAWTHGNQVLQVLPRLKERFRARRDELAVPQSPEEELRRISSQDDARVDRWTRVARQAGLARLAVERQAWTEAAARYRDLQGEGDLFPEARVAIGAIVASARDAADTALRAGQIDAAMQQLDQALAIVSPDDDATTDADLRVRLARAHFERADTGMARLELSRAIDGYSGGSDAGSRIGTLCAGLLRDVEMYWRLDADWREWSEETGLGEMRRTALASARRALVAYLDTAYQLASPQSATAFLPVVIPIALELGSALIPEETGTDTWNLFTTLIPSMRDRLRAQTGVGLPGVRVRANDDLAPSDYVVLLNEIPRARGSARFDAIDPLEPVVRHLESVLRRNMGQFFGISEADALLDTWMKSDEGEPPRALRDDGEARLRAAHVLRALVMDGVRLEPEPLVDALQAVRPVSGTLDDVLDKVRQRIRPLLPGNSHAAERIPLPDIWDDALTSWIRDEGSAARVVAPPEDEQAFVTALRAQLGGAGGNAVLIVPHAAARAFVRRLIAVDFPDVMVVARDELLAGQHRPPEDPTMSLAI